MNEVSVEIVTVVALVLLNGIFVLAEIALVSSRRSRLQQWAESGDRKAQKALELIQTPGRFLATVQLVITLVGIMVGAISDRLAGYLEPHFAWVPYAQFFSLASVVLAITYLHVVLGELFPKAMALRHAESIARRVARPMGQLSRLVSPAVTFLNASIVPMLRLFGSRHAQEPAVTEGEISVMLAQGTKAGVFEESQQDMMESVIEMGDRRITSIMTARPDIAWLDTDATSDDIRAMLSAAPHSRFPVCSGSFDEVLGVVHTKDLLARRLAGEPLDLRALAKPIPTIPDSVPVLKALEAFRASAANMAFVSDEYGSLMGLVTLTDVLQNILGDMAAKQSSASESDAVKRNDGSWLIDGIKPVEELKELLGMASLPGEEENAYQTLGGFVMARLGRIPKTGDAFDAGGWSYEVMDMDGRRVDKVMVKSLPVPNPSGQA